MCVEACTMLPLVITETQSTHASTVQSCRRTPQAAKTEITLVMNTWPHIRNLKVPYYTIFRSLFFMLEPRKINYLKKMKQNKLY